MYKKSKYNIEVDTLANGDILFFNTLTTAYGIMNEYTKKLYDSIEEVDLKNLKNSDDLSKIETLLQNGYVISEEIDELDMLRLKAQIGKFMVNRLSLTIAPTLNCNMACPYCFEKKKDISMSKSVQDDLCKFVDEFVMKRDCKEVNIIWYGGEPLLETDIIYGLSEKFIDICNKGSIHYSAGIITNGVLLERKVAEKLKIECKVTRAQITIDGLPECHNKRRILVDGSDSFDIIVNNIEACKDLLDISVRVNVDKDNMNDVEKLANYFVYDKGWYDNPEFNIAPVVEYESNCGCCDCISGEEYGKLDFQIMELLNNINATSVKKHFYSHCKALACTAVQYGTYVVDPDGDLYTCFNVIGNKEEKIGNITRMWEISPAYAKWLLYEPGGKCLECNLFPLCAGGCPYKFFVNGEPTCDNVAYNFKGRLKLAYKDYIKQKAAEEK